jgi:hypothetical protein
VIICLLDVLAVSDPPNHAHRYLGWLRLTHICSRWRSISLDYTPIWARHVCALPHALDTLISRARGLPLVLAYSERLSKTYETRLVHAASDHIRSLAVLRLTAHSYAWPSLLAAKRLPNLHLVELSSDPGHARSADRSYSYTPYAVLDAPALRAASFAGGVFLRLRAPGLRALALAHQPVDVAMLLDVLAGSPLLEELALEKCLFVYRPPEAHDVVPLAHLRCLGLWGSARPCAALLARLTIPDDACITVALNRGADDPDSGVQERDGVLRTLVLRCAPHIQHTSHDALTLSFSVEDNTFTFFVHASDTGLGAHGVPARGFKMVAPVGVPDIELLFGALPPRSVRSLDVRAVGIWWHGVSRMLRDCAGLRDVCAVHCALSFVPADREILDGLLTLPAVFSAMRTVTARMEKRDGELGAMMLPGVIEERLSGSWPRRGDMAESPLKIVLQIPRGWGLAVPRTTRGQGYEILVEEIDEGEDEEERGDGATLPVVGRNEREAQFDAGVAWHAAVDAGPPAYSV